MPTHILAVIANTFKETLRQPVSVVIVAIAVLLNILAPSVTLFALDEDRLLMRDTGISTLLMTGLFLAVFAAANVLTEEISNRTALTVISKTIGRATFLFAKFIGITAAVLLCQYIVALSLMMMDHRGVPTATQTVLNDSVLVTGAIAGSLAILAGALGGYFYRKPFSSTTLLSAAALGTLGAAIQIFVLDAAQDARTHRLLNQYFHTSDLIAPVVLTFLSTVILCALVTTLSTRLHLALTLTISLVLFVVGTMIQIYVGPLAASSDRLMAALGWIILAVVPNFQFFTVSNAIFTEAPVSIPYIALCGVYAVCYSTAILLIGTALFRSRDLG